MFSNSNQYDDSQNNEGLFYNGAQSLSSSQYINDNRISLEGYSADTSPYQRTYTNKSSDDNNNFKVMVRVRPPLPRELESGQLTPTIQVGDSGKRVTIYEYYNLDALDGGSPNEYLENNNMFTSHNFTFDKVYDPRSTQNEVYEGTAKPAVMSVLQGYNATILAYGQTGTGKTFTMEGFKFNSQDPQRGIVPRSMEEIFKYIENVSNSRTTFMVRVSYLQIYNEVVSDLLRTDRTNLHIREDKKRGVFVEGLSEWAVRSPHEIYSLIQKGASSRATAATRMNDMSSRSHAVFIIIVEQMITNIDEETGEELKEIRVGKLNLVDLAGSERVRVTGATGKRLEECKKINQSLSALGNVISALADLKQTKTHIPYRDSKITRLLEDSLGGNCITTMMAMVSPTIDAFGESLSTLKFANRAKNIKNAPIINEDADQKALLRKYEAELKKLRTELDERNKNLFDGRKVSQLEEDRRKAEQDKVAAFEALEKRSKEFLQEREEKKKLEEKIKAMYSQMLVGGRKMEESEFKSALEEQQKIIRQQYDQRLQELEKERQLIEEDKAQVDRYKQLLLKQRDIMIALTTRLNERDETIIQLQEELDAYDRIHRETEDMLEMKDRRVHELENALNDNNVPIPNENREDVGEPILKNLNDPRQYRNSSPDLITIDDQQKGTLPTDVSAIVEANNQRNAQIIDDLESQLQAMAEKARRAEDEQNRLRETLYQKDEQIRNQQRSDSNSGQNNENLWFVQKEIKLNVDYIIDSLSSQNEPQRLQDVARDLLNLQKLVNSVFSLTTEPETEEYTESTASRSGGIPPSELHSAGMPPRTSEFNGTDMSNKTREERQDQHRGSLTAARVLSDPVGDHHGTIQQQINPRHLATKSSMNEAHTSNNQSDMPSKQPASTQPPPLTKVTDAKKSVENKPSLENKRSISTGIFGKYMGNLVTLDPERKPMTVEEMLKMKREQPSKKK